MCLSFISSQRLHLFLIFQSFQCQEQPLLCFFSSNSFLTLCLSRTQNGRSLQSNETRKKGITLKTPMCHLALRSCMCVCVCVWLETISSLTFYFFLHRGTNCSMTEKVLEKVTLTHMHTRTNTHLLAVLPMVLCFSEEEDLWT